MLTILGGQWGGRRLKAIDREGLRPSSSRVKASIFSLLEAIQWKKQGSPSFEGMRCLDLFAGVGGLGIEMLSRGASFCTFVEKERAQARTLQENLKSLECEKQALLLVEDIDKIKWEKLGTFDVILMDPPYAKSAEMPELIEQMMANSVLNAGGILLVEHDPKFRFAELSSLEKHSERTLGPAGISVFVSKSTG